MSDQAALNADVEKMVQRLRASFASGKTRSMSHRRAQLRGLQKMLREKRSEWEEALAKDLRKSPFEAYNMEINPVEHEVQHMLEHMDSYASPRYLWMDPLKWLIVSMTGHGRAALYRDPLGVCLIIGAWNCESRAHRCCWLLVAGSTSPSLPPSLRPSVPPSPCPLPCPACRLPASASRQIRCTSRCCRSSARSRRATW